MSSPQLASTSASAFGSLLLARVTSPVPSGTAFLGRGTTSSSVSVASEAASPLVSTVRSRFDPQSILQPQIAQILSQKLRMARWEKLDKERNRALSRSIAEAVKGKMVELEPKGFKYIVQVQLVENLGQGGRADLACHWEDSDSVTQEMYSNDTLICTVLYFAIRV